MQCFVMYYIKSLDKYRCIQENSVNEDGFHLFKDDDSSSEVDESTSDSDFSLSEDDDEDVEEDEVEPKKVKVEEKQKTVATTSNKLKDDEAVETKLPAAEPGTVSSSDGMVALDLVGHFIIDSYFCVTLHTLKIFITTVTT